MRPSESMVWYASAGHGTYPSSRNSLLWYGITVRVGELDSSRRWPRQEFLARLEKVVVSLADIRNRSGNSDYRIWSDQGPGK